MKLMEQWKKEAYELETEKDYNDFWNKYLEEEKSIYDKILNEKSEKVSGTVLELSEKFDVTPMKICGFIDGVNSSLEEEIDLYGLKEETQVELIINFEKLYYNMQDAKAPWLYNLEGWEDVLSKEKRDEITKQYKKDSIVRVNKIGRNEPCICGSGKKYKKCCGK